MKKLFYPAIFHKADEGGFWISFPDFPECFSDGEDMNEAYEMASDALGLALTSRKEAGEKIPAATNPCQLELSENEFAVVIEFDMMAYMKKHHSRAVKKTLSIPEWMNEEAIAHGINFSQVLQEALLLKLQA